MNNKERLELLDRLGMCHQCEKARPAPGKKYCYDCLDKNRERCAARYDPEYAKAYQARRRELYREHKANGICVRCSRKATHGMHCYEHHIEQRRRSSINAARRRNERADRGLVPEYRKANGLCLRCGEPIDGTGNSFCSKCCEKCGEWARMANTPWREFMYPQNNGEQNERIEE